MVPSIFKEGVGEDCISKIAVEDSRNELLVLPYLARYRMMSADSLDIKHNGACLDRCRSGSATDHHHIQFCQTHAISAQQSWQHMIIYSIELCIEMLFKISQIFEHLY